MNCHKIGTKHCARTPVLTHAAVALNILLGVSSAWGVDTLATFALPRLQVDSIPRKLLVVNGSLVTGSVAVSYRAGKLFVNAEQWLPRPDQSSAPPSVRPRMVAASDSLKAMRIPFIAQRARPGVAISEQLNAYHRQINAMGVAVLREYRRARAEGDRNAPSRAAGLIDTALATASQTGPMAPRWSDDAVSLYFTGYGWYEFSELGPGQKFPGGAIDSVEARRSAQGLERMLSGDSEQTVVVLDDASLFIQGGSQADVAARQLSIIYGSDEGAISDLVASTPRADVSGIPGYILHRLAAASRPKPSTRP